MASQLHHFCNVRLVSASVVLLASLTASPASARGPRPLSPATRALVDRVYRETGYILDDRGPRPNPEDRQGWTDGEVRRMARVLASLPQQLRFLAPPGSGPVDAAGRRGMYLTRDSMNQEEQSLWASLESTLAARLRTARVERAPLRRRAALAGQLAAVRGVRALRMGTVFGNAYYDRPEIRLYNELLHGSRLPGLRRMLAFTTVHEIGHEQLQGSPELQAAWTRHFLQGGGREEYSTWCGYAAGSVHEGYGVGIGTFAVAPELLRKKAPRTYQFFVQRFGADAFKALRGGVTERLAIQLVYKLSDLSAGLGRGSGN
jgi:hypothetical protein